MKLFTPTGTILVKRLDRLEHPHSTSPHGVVVHPGLSQLADNLYAFEAIKEGNHVFFAEGAGTEISIAGVTHLILEKADVLVIAELSDEDAEKHRCSLTVAHVPQRTEVNANGDVFISGPAPAIPGMPVPIAEAPGVRHLSSESRRAVDASRGPGWEAYAGDLAARLESGKPVPYSMGCTTEPIPADSTFRSAMEGYPATRDESLKDDAYAVTENTKKLAWRITNALCRYCQPEDLAGMGPLAQEVIAEVLRQTNRLAGAANTQFHLPKNQYAHATTADYTEIWSTGALAEINRNVLHPLGYALGINEDAEAMFMWRTDDPKGIWFDRAAFKPSHFADAATKLRAAQVAKAARSGRDVDPGFIVQPAQAAQEPKRPLIRTTDAQDTIRAFGALAAQEDSERKTRPRGTIPVYSLDDPNHPVGYIPVCTRTAENPFGDVYNAEKVEKS
jgi:co-chaperonin GroES (HSP10)